MHSIPVYSNIVEMSQNPLALENTITAAPSLNNDPVLIGIGGPTGQCVKWKYCNA